MTTVKAGGKRGAASSMRGFLSSQLLTFIAAGAVVTLATVVGTHHYQSAGDSRSAHEDLFGQRDFRRIPFDEYDATQVCQHKAKRQFGDALLRSHVDDHSTRFEPQRDIFVVSLIGNVGTPQQFEDVFIYCYVDPHEYAVTYYDTVYAEQRSLMSRALSFFN